MLKAKKYVDNFTILPQTSFLVLQDEGGDRPVRRGGGRVRDGGDQRGGAGQARQLPQEARQAQAARQETGTTLIDESFGNILVVLCILLSMQR